ALTARWDSIDFENRRWRLNDTKNKHGRFVVLNDMALRVLHCQRTLASEEYVFPATRGRLGHLADPSKAFKRVLKAAGITNLRLH
ncbi:tyrosine-type recombinase/integrase, partial [Streptococcus pyogenes]